MICFFESAVIFYLDFSVKAPIMAATTFINTASLFFIENKTESFARQRIHTAHQSLFSSKDKSKIIIIIII